MSKKVENSELDKYLKSLLGTDYSAFISAPPEQTAIRTNTLKTTTNHITHLLDTYNYDYKKISFNSDGFILNSDPIPLSHSLAFFEGLFQYQGVSSQLPVIILDVQPGECVLDMTAAPGSKSSQLAARMAESGELVLNDSSTNRLQGLQANMQRSGAINHIILKQRGENLSRIYPEYFDKVLLDAPCTALGTYFSTTEKYNWWSNAKLKKLASLQYQLILSALKCLKVGGELVYSTCSISPEENELMIEKIIRKYPLEVIDIDQTIQSNFANGWVIYKNKPISAELTKALRVWPHIHGYEGFFVLKLRKTDSLKSENDKPSIEKSDTYTADHLQVKDVLKELSDSWGIDDNYWINYRYILTKTRIWMMSPNVKNVPVENFISAGLLLGEKRLSGWKPVNGSAQYLSNLITKRRITLSDEEIHNLFKNGKIKFKKLPMDYYVLEFRDRLIGSLYHEKGIVKIRLPHLFRRFRI